MHEDVHRSGPSSSCVRCRCNLRAAGSPNGPTSDALDEHLTEATNLDEFTNQINEAVMTKEKLLESVETFVQHEGSIELDPIDLDDFGTGYVTLHISALHTGDARSGPSNLIIYVRMQKKKK